MDVKKTVLITGANRGLGLGFVRYYLAKDWTVFACVRSEKKSLELRSLFNEYPNNLVIEPLDVSDANSIDAFSVKLKEYSILFDLVINNAGVFTEENLGDWKIATFENTFKVNTFGVALFSQVILPFINSSGKLVNISSGLGSIENIINPETGFEAYAMSKAALNMFTKRLASKSETKDIVVVALSPGWVQTDMGGKDAPLTIPEAIGKMGVVIEQLTSIHSGKFLSEEGDQLPW